MLTYWAWAKVNLYLEVTGRRPDGYHELDSLVVFAGIGDRLTIAPAEPLTLSVAGPFGAGVPAGPENLVLKAAAALRQASGCRKGAALRLEKHLPAAAGLGGGSADAAAALHGLSQLWDLQVAPAELREIGMAVGADLPVCLFGRPALVGGAGERIDRAPALPGAWLLLVNPGVALATKAVFAARQGAFTPAAPPLPLLPDLSALADELASRRNDLEAPACRLAPEIAEVLTAIGGLEGCHLARMSGSGASCFGLFDTAAAPLLHGRMTAHWRD